MSVKVAHDQRILDAPAGSRHAETFVEEHSRRGIEHDVLLAGMIRVILLVALNVAINIRAQARQLLGADDVIGRRGPALRYRRQIAPAGKTQALLIARQVQDHWAARALRNSPAQFRDLAGVDGLDGRNRLPRQIPGLLRLQVVLGFTNECDHSLVGLARRGAEREDTVVHQNHADRVGTDFARENLGAYAGQVEARHRVGNDNHAVPVYLANALLAVGRIGYRHDGVGVGMVHVLVGKNGVQDSLDRRRRRRGVGHVGPQLVYHLWIRQLLELGERKHMPHADRGESTLFDGLEVPAAALHVENILGLAEDVVLRDLDRRVAAAVQHQLGITAQEARAVDALREVADITGCLVFVPEIVHRLLVGVFGLG